MTIRRVLLQLLAATLVLLWCAVPAHAAEQADVEITQTGSPNPAPVGGQLTWTILVRNLGPGTAVNVEVNGNFNQYGPTTEFVSLDISSGTCTHATSTYNCQIGTVAAGATVTLTLVVTVLSGNSVASVADVSTGSSDPDWSNNHSVGEVSAGPAADVRLAESATPTTVAPGDSVTYTFTVTNAGPTTASGLELSDVLPAGLVGARVTPSSDCAVNGSDVSCSRASLSSGATVEVTVTATVDPSFSGTELVNDAVVTTTSIDSDPSNNAASAVVHIEAPAADLSVAKSVAPDDPVAGEPVAYTLVVRNSGPSGAADATLSDELPASLDDLSVSTDVGSCTLAGRTVGCDFGSVPSGGVVTVTVEGVVSPSASGTVRNTATVDSTTRDPEPDNNSSTAAFTVGNSADLAIAKTAEPESATNGDEVTYTLVVANHGPSDAPTIEVTDELPDGLTYASCATPQGSCSATGATVRFSLGTMSAGASVELRVTGTVDADFPGGELANTATVTHDGTDPDPDNNSASYRLNLAAAADVSLAKTVSPSPVVAGHAITYTLTATNAGPGTAHDLELTDAVPARVQVTGVTASAGTCDSGVSNAVHCTLDDLAVGGDWTVTVTGTLDPATPRGILSNRATVAVPDDPTDSNNTALVVVPVATRADLTITKTAPETVVAGGELTYVLSVTNAGPSTARSTVAVDRLPAGTTFVSGGGGGVTCAPEDGAPELVVCPIGTLAPSTPTAFSITVRVDPATPDGATLTNRAQASSTTRGVSTGLPATALTDVTASADLATTKTVLPGVLVAGGHATYVIRVHNAGPSSAVDVRLDDAVPSALSIDQVSPGGGSCRTSGGTISCARDSLSAGATWVVVVQVTVDASASGQVVNSATASSATTDPAPDDNTGTVAAEVVASADVAIVKTALFARLNAGQTAIFFLSAVGSGPSVASDVMVSDTFPAGLTPTAVTGSACAISGQRVSCTYPSLGNGEIRTAMVTAIVGADVTEGELTNTATITASTPDPESGNDSDDAVVSVAPLADLVLAKTVDPTEAAPGDTVAFTIRLTNAGPSITQDALVRDELPDGLAPQDVTAAAPLACTTSGQVVQCSAASLPVGDYLIGVTARVADDADDGTLTNSATVSARTADPDLSSNTARAALTISAEPSTGGGGGLAFTGAGGTSELLGAGLVALASGALLLLVRRRVRRVR